MLTVFLVTMAIFIIRKYFLPNSFFPRGINIRGKKEFLIAGIVTIVILVIIAISHHDAHFQIKDNNIKEVIIENVSKTEKTDYSLEDIQIRKSLELNWGKIILFSFFSENGREVVGSATFSKGLNNRYAVDKIFYEETFLHTFVTRDFLSEYLIFAGKNYLGTINSIEINQKDGRSFKKEVSRDKYFIIKVDADSLDNFRILNIQDEEIKY